MTQHILEQAFDILDRAWNDERPAFAVSLVSGGNDSMATWWAAAQWAQRRGVPLKVAHINTGIGVAETRQFVRAQARAFGWDYHEYQTDPQIYVDLVTGKYEPIVPGGFPGAPLHYVYYTRLKDRQIERIPRDFPRPRGRPVMFITGLRKQESRRRMGYDNPIQRETKRPHLWVNPLFYVNAAQMREIRDVSGIAENLVSACLHMSGECLCGAMNQPGELELIRFFYPDTARQIDAIAAQVQAAGYPWNWDATMPSWYLPHKRGQLFLDGFAPLCSSCEARNAA